MRYLLLALPLLLAQAPVAQAQVTLGIGIQLSGVSIGINLPALPDLVLVPGYPVYYAPQAAANYFFYDGLYWVFRGEEWYASDWYNGPWRRVGPDHVPAYVLRVPVRYYRQPPAYFHAWRADAPPHWGERWGQDWEQRRSGWDRWDRRAAPPPAPVPAYQRKYPQSRYPQEPAQQHSIRSDNYRYQPRDPVAHRQYQEPDRAPAPRAQPRFRPQPMPQDPRPQAAPQDRSREPQRAEPPHRGPDRQGDAGDPRRDDRPGDQRRDDRGDRGRNDDRGDRGNRRGGG